MTRGPPRQLEVPSSNDGRKAAVRVVGRKASASQPPMWPAVGFPHWGQPDRVPRPSRTEDRAAQDGLLQAASLCAHRGRQRARPTVD